MFRVYLWQSVIRLDTWAAACVPCGSCCLAGGCKNVEHKAQHGGQQRGSSDAQAREAMNSSIEEDYSHPQKPHEIQRQEHWSSLTALSMEMSRSMIL